MTVWVTRQVPEVIYDGLREALAAARRPRDHSDVGGGFGQKIHLIRKYVVLVSAARDESRPAGQVDREDRTST